uniref:Uncharacterized protein n=1 Tax=Fagus sylvatica TaxID=28930 RepID=A0A2N9J4D3_FAGSY
MEAGDIGGQHLSASNRQMHALTANVQELARQSAAGQNGGEAPRNKEGRNQNQYQNVERSSANQNRVPPPSQVANPTRFAADARAAKLEEELKEMREQMKEMKSQVKAKAAKNLDILVHHTESSFTKRVDEYPLPAKFKVPQLKTFDGLKDPLDYLDSFRTVMRLQGVSDEIMCRAFPTNLRGSTRIWFNQLETGSIDTFAQLSPAFIDNFIGGRRLARPANYLLNIRQREGESLRSYVQRFNKEAVQIDELNEYVALTAFNAGLCKGDFLFQLCKDPPRSMSELMYEAQKFINTEDAFKARDEFPSKKRKESEDRQFESSKSRSSKQDYLKIDRKNDDPKIKWPGKLRSNPAKRSKDLYCRFHRDHSHTTEDCYALKEQIETLIRQGKLRKFVRRDNRETRPELRLPRQEENKDRTEDRPWVVIGEIRTIVGGLVSGGTSRLSRKAYARQAHNILVTQRPRKNVKMDDKVITFSEDDVRAYQQIKINKERLRPIDIPLMGFTGDKVRPSGVVSLMIEAGMYPKQVRTSVEFLVVDCPSAYNVIIGRSTLNKLRVVTSTYHLLVRFPTEHSIRELKGDQATAKECYFASLGLETRHQTMTIDEGQRLVEPTEKLEVVVLDDEKPHKTTSIGTKMDERLRESMIKFLKSNSDVFAWTHDDMPSINPSTICHRLNVDSSIRPIKQKRRVFAPDRNQAISDEVEKFLTVGFIREAYYPDWLANVVIVKKPNGKWRMCVDFMDLNKTCPKDRFPLPRIDQFVDSTAGHRLLTFMDAFSGYNHIMMDEGDQEKTSFITSKGPFCYRVMPFRLENTGATYQRLMNKMFHNQIKRNVEVYIDDMLVKTKDEANHLEDLEETFKTLCQYRMKLNPKLKVYLTSPPLLSPSQQGETLSLYLVVSLTAVSSALIREEGGTQLLVYYTSKAFQGAEERYLAMEKLALALAMNKPDVARRLIQWVIELSEFDIEYRPRQAIKAQALADFIAEFTVAEEEPSKEKLERKWEVEIDGSSVKGAGGVGIVFKTPEGHLLKHSVLLQYPTTNNEAEYEALLTGLRIARELGATTLRVQSDSQLIVGQVNGEYEAKEDRMAKYLNLVRNTIRWFDEVTLVQVPREQNTEADTLAKLASSEEAINQQIEVQYSPSHTEKELNPIDVNNSWMTPITKYLKEGTLPTNLVDARKLKVRSCQRFGNLIHSPPETLTPMTAPWPFAQWGLDIMGPLLVGRRQLKFLVVGIDYFTKWVEVEPLATITEKNVRGFVWKAIICRFGIPRAFVSDNGGQFDNSPFREFCEELGIRNHYSSPDHPQANGQVEVTNRSLLKMIKTRLKGLRTNLDLLDEARNQAEAKTRAYQQRMARYHDRRVKYMEFKVRDLVLRKVTLVTKDPTQGKLGPTWERPYRVIKFHRRGTYHLERLDGTALPHLWNAEHLKKYYQ